MNLLVIAGETSGDSRGSELLEKLLEYGPVQTFGLGGENLAAKGMDLIYDLREYSMMGFTEIIGSLARIRRLESGLRKACSERKPDAVLLVDYPGFNLRFARWAHRSGLPVIYYISPQIWAWGGWRVGKIRKNIDLMITLFDFEQKFYRNNRVNAFFAGHPLVDKVILREKAEGKCLALLPGSRKQEITGLLPRMLKAYLILREQGVVEGARIAVSPEVDPSQYSDAQGLTGVELCSSIAHALESSSAALVCSGTATLETAMHGIPFVVCYRTSTVTYLLARILVRGVNRIGMANIVAGRDVAPELIQMHATGSRMAEETAMLMLDEQKRSHALEGLALVRRKLGPPGGAARAAEKIWEFLNQ